MDRSEGHVKRDRSWNSMGDSPNSKRPSSLGMPSTLRVLLRSIDAGGIIGKGGENIKRMRKKYDCQVQLPDSAGNPERVLTVIGDRDNCIGVFEECLEKVKNEIKRRDMHAPIEVQILIPQPFMGTIIGTGGMKIKELRKRTNCNIKIFSESMPYSNERSISLSGNEEEIINCVSFFLQEIGQREPKEPIILYDPSVPQEMPPFDYPPQHGYRRGRGRGGRGGGGRMYDGRGGGGRGGGGHNYRSHQQGPPPPHSQHQSGPPPGLLPPSDGNMGPPPSIGSQDNSNKNPMPPAPGSGVSPQQPLLQQQVRSNQSGEPVSSLFTQGPPPTQTVQYPTPGSSSTNQPPPTAGSGAPSYPTQTHPPTSGPLNPPQGYVPPPNISQGNYSTATPQPLATGVAPSPLVNQTSQPPLTQYPQAGTMPPVPPQSSYPAGNQPPVQSHSQYSQDGYANQTGYGNSQAPTSYSQTNYVPAQPAGGYSATNYQQPHPSYPPPPVPPTQTQPYYGGGGQYQTAPNPVFPAANAMQTGYQSTEQQTKQVTIPHEFSSAILGHGGSKLLQIRTQSRCNITMDDVKPNSKERVITIVGSSMDIAMAEQLMKDSVRQHHTV